MVSLPLILSAIGVTGLGASMVAFPTLGALVLNAVLGFLAKLPWQVYALLGLAVLIGGLIFSRAHWMDRDHSDEAQLAAICQAVRTADHNPKLDCGKTGAQVVLMGQALDNTLVMLNRQSAAINALAAKSAQEQAESKQALQTAQERAGEAEAVSEHLAASSRAGGAPSASCQPSKALQDQWK